MIHNAETNKRAKNISVGYQSLSLIAQSYIISYFIRMIRNNIDNLFIVSLSVVMILITALNVMMSIVTLGKVLDTPVNDVNDDSENKDQDNKSDENNK